MQPDEEINEYLPKKKSDPMFPPYSPLEHQTVKSLGHKFHAIELDYNPFAFDEPPQCSELMMAFKLFYDNKTGGFNLVRKEEIQAMDMRIGIPRESPKITFELDSGKNYMKFMYLEEDTDSGKVVDEFIKKLVER